MKQEFNVGSDVVKLDPTNMEFNETNLTTYLQKEGGYYNNFGAHLATAEFILQRREADYDALYGEKFKTYKDEGGSDKFVEARTDSDTDIVEAKAKIVNARYKVRLLQQHLRAWDKNHENAQSLGHYLRKEMDKLNSDITLGQSRRTDVMQQGFDELIDKNISHFKPDGTIQ